MRRALIAVVFALAAAPLAAQQPPPKLEPLPGPPPPPPGAAVEQPNEAPVRITPGPNDRVEETVVDGRRVVRVTTPNGTVYFLDDRDQAPEGPTGRPVRVPLWVIQQF